ncbi:LOW QUALITY PROTEIN: FH2 domain-containing protein 1-like [Lepus europaeus]|uniref:LOW QUALITY PROTEIN: FH2 domain-containing protein 1-like n=1 Tax=Lepus europaeus TaxID=9983 RepID=UPI002B482309|nr:LOW QUALITY PROTEIN: FH2 domain-containing protein 1-like [Lepus europaeus]
MYQCEKLATSLWLKEEIQSGTSNYWPKSMTSFKLEEEGGGGDFPQNQVTETGLGRAQSECGAQRAHLNNTHLHRCILGRQWAVSSSRLTGNSRFECSKLRNRSSDLKVPTSPENGTVSSEVSPIHNSCLQMAESACPKERGSPLNTTKGNSGALGAGVGRGRPAGAILPFPEPAKRSFLSDVPRGSLVPTARSPLSPFRLSLDSTEAELRSLFVRTRSLQENMRRDAELDQQMEDFLQFAVEKLTELEHWKQELQDKAHTLIDFFCEDKETMKLDECLQIFRDFCVKFNKAVQDNHDLEVQELRKQQWLKDLEQKRQSWTAGDLGGFGQSSSENDMELLTQKGSEDLPPFLHPRPSSPSYRPPSSRRSRHSLGLSADLELLTFLESSSGSSEESNKFNSLPRSSLRQARPTPAWMEPGVPRRHDSNVAPRAEASESQERAPNSCSEGPSQPPAPPGHQEPASAFPRARRSGASVLRKRNSEPVCLGPAWSPPLSPLALGIEEHELVTGLAQFSLQGRKGLEEPSRLTPSDSSPEGQESAGDRSPPQPLSSEGRGSPRAPSPAVEDGGAAPEEPSRAAPVSAGSSDPENKDHTPMFYVSDATDCSLTLDCSEGTDSRPSVAQPEAAGDEGASESSGAGTTPGSQVSSSNPASSPAGEVPAVAVKSEPDAHGGLPRVTSAKGKDTATPKRNPPREAAPGTCRSASVRRGQGATPKPVRTLNASESESMRKVVPISKASRGPAGWKRPEPPPSRASPRDSPGSVDARLSRRGSALGPADTSPRRPSTGAGAAVAVEEPRPPRGSARSPRKGADSAEAPGASRETPPKGRALGERASFRLRDACPPPGPEVSA